MDTTATKRTLRLVRPGDTDGTTGPASDPHAEGITAPSHAPLTTEAYWARVQALRADRDRLRPAN
jgi:hypothetical protein